MSAELMLEQAIVEAGAVLESVVWHRQGSHQCDCRWTEISEVECAIRLVAALARWEALEELERRAAHPDRPCNCHGHASLGIERIAAEAEVARLRQKGEP